MKKLRKIFAATMMLTTVFSMSMLAAPKADAASAGDLVKLESGSAVYYIGEDGKKHVFPNESTYFSWYSDFSGITIISQSELDGFARGANVTVRPGTVLVTSPDEATVYAVEKGGVLRSIVSEENAKALYGANWAKNVIDVSASFMSNYVAGEKLTEGKYPQGTLVKTSTSPDVYYIDADGKARKFADAASFLANNFKWDDIVTTSLTLPSLGTAISGEETAITDVASGNGTGAVIDPNAGSGLTVSLSSATPEAKTVPSGATGVTFTKFNVTASNDGNVTLKNLVIKRSGVGAYNEVSKVYLYDGTTRLTSGKSINSSSNEASLSNINFVIPAGTTKTLSIVGDIATGLGSYGNQVLSIQSASAITTNGATVSGSFPVSGNQMALSSTSVGKADIESAGADWTRKVGEDQVEVANFTVYVNNTEDAEFQGITLYNSGRDVLSNLKMYRGSTLVAEGTKSGDYFVFTLTTPYVITKSDSASFSVKGDIDGRDTDTATLDVRYNTDVRIIGKTYGYSLYMDATVGTADSYVDEAISTAGAGTLTANTTTVNAGQITVSFNGPSTGDVSKDTNDVVLMNFSLTTQAPVTVEKMILTIAHTGLLTTEVSNLEVVCAGQIVADTSSVVLGDNTFTDTWELNSGTTDCQARIDILNTAAGNETISVALKNLTNTANWTLKDGNGDRITDVVPSGDIAGNTMNVTSASVTASLASSPASGQTYVKGQKDASIAGFTFTAGDSVDTKVTALSLLAYQDNNSDYNFTDANEKDQASGAANTMVNIKLYDGETLLASKSLTVGASTIGVTFDSLNISIPKGTDKTITVKSDISTSATAKGVAIALNTVTAEYGNGKNLAVTGSKNTTPTTYQVVSAGGTLVMSTDSGTPSAGLMVAGATGSLFSSVKFSATNEDFVIDKLAVVNDRYTTVGDDEFSTIKLEYTNKEGVTKTISKGLTDGVAQFSGLDIFVKKDDKAIVKVKADLNTTTGGADNGHYTSLKVASSTNLYSFRAVGTSGVVKTNTASADIDGNDMVVFKTIPTFAMASNSPSGALTPNAETLVAKIAVTADAGEDVTFIGADGNELTVNLLISLTASDGNNDSLILKNDDGETLAATTTLDLNTATEYTFDFGTKDFTVAAGTTEYLYIYADTRDFTQDGDSIQIKLDDTAGDIDWSIDGDGNNYNYGNIIFKNDILSGSLLKA